MIYCIWYPAGGFGHFVNSILSLHGKGFVRPQGQNVEFSSNGNSHKLDLVAPKYWHNPDCYNFEFDSTKNYSVLIDNGINDETTLFVKFFPTAHVVKICYSNNTWPIISRTMIEKAMGVDLSQEVSIGTNWNTQEDWAIREKYFLFLRDNTLRHAWKIDPSYAYLKIDDMLCYNNFCGRLESLGINTSDFKALWDNWKISNRKYIDPVEIAQKVIKDVKNKNYSSLSHVTDIWTQAVVYYYIWLEYNFEVPHNDYDKWFTSTEQIVIMLNKYGVSN
jgi:hypothetical protein